MMVKKTFLSDSFEFQKKTAHEVVNGLLAKEIIAERKTNISQSELLEARARGSRFAKKYGL